MDWTLDELRTAITREIEIMGDTCEQPPPRPALKQILFTSTQPSQTIRKKKYSFCAEDHSLKLEERTRIVKMKKLLLF